MNFLKTLFCMVSILILSAINLHAQEDTVKVKNNKLYIITTSDGGEFIGIILSQDAKEVLIDTKDRGQVSIPKYQIKEMHVLESGELNSSGDYIPKEVFATRYFITTNGLPIEKGENYVQWNLWGADVQFGVGKNLGVGVMTSWFGMPIVGTIKYSIPLGEKLNLGLGALVGTGSWIRPDFGLALPFGALTLGDRRKNITFSGGYGAVFTDGLGEGRALLSIAGMSKAGKKVSFVFDSFIVPPGVTQTSTGYNYQGSPYTITTRKPGFALLIPGFRIQTKEKAAFQFGFGGLILDGNATPLPIPFVQWYRKF